jgi:glucose/arabinose dehydrogenase
MSVLVPFAQRCIAFACLLATALLPPLPAAAQTTPIGQSFELVRVASGLNLGVGFAFAPDGTMFIAEKGGVVRVLRGGALLPTPFVDLSAEVNNTSDRGLLGIAVHPSFPAQPYVYLLYTYDPPEVQGQLGLPGPDQGGARVARLLRLTADANAGHNVALASGRTVLLGAQSVYANIGNPAGRNDYSRPSCFSAGAYVRDCIPADELSHTIGTVTFGPDGMLYVSSGDGCDYTRAQTVCTRSQDLDSLAGKVLRIDPLTGTAPTSNPFFDGDANSNRSKVYQLGLRNPFRMSFDSVTGALHVGDVGWNTWEEINRAGAGANFGWPCYEGNNSGNLAQPNYTNMARCAALRDSGAAITRAIHAYDHAGTSSSVQVGDVYRGDRYPALYRGSLFYTDYNKQELRFLTFDAARNVTGSQLFANGLSGMVQVSSDPLSKDLFIMRIQTGGAGASGAIDRLRYVAPEPGILPAGVYRLRSALNQACTQAFPARTFFGIVISPARFETQTCQTIDAQRFTLDNLGNGAYRLTSRSLSQALTASGTTVVPRAVGSGGDQRWRVRRVSNGYQLQNEATGTCLLTQSSATVSAHGLAACNDTPAQTFNPLLDGNRAPVVAAIPNQRGNVGDNVTLVVSASDADGHALAYRASGLPAGLTIDAVSGTIAGQLAAIGEHTVQVTVGDGFVETSTSFAFKVEDDRVPVVSLLEPAAGTQIMPGQTIAFEGSAVDFTGAPLPPAALSWQLLVHHNQHVHFDGMPPTTGPSGSFVVEDHGDNTWLELCLTAVDGFGRAAVECRELRPREVDYTLTTVPAGLTLPWEGVARVTPFTVRTHVGGSRALSAPLAQNGYAFVAWSDGGAAAHEIVIGASALTLTATYASTGPTPGTYRLRAEHSQKCVEHRPATFWLWIETAPERFAQYPCASAAPQRFALTDNGDGSFRLISASSNRALAVSGASTAENAAVVPVAYTGAAAQRWRLTTAGTRYTLQNVNSGKCLEVQSASTADNAALVQTTCANRPSQRFELAAP